MVKGRNAESPFELPRAAWFPILARAKTRFSEDRLSLVAAGVAFFGLLALFPSITALLAIAGLVMDPSDVISQLENLEGVVPADVLSIIRDQATSVSTSQGLGLALLVSVVLALWSASRGVNSLTEGLNVAYDEEEERGFVKKNLQVLGLTLLIIFGLILGLVAIVGMPIILSYIPLGPIAQPLIQIGTWLLLALMTIGGLSLVYRYGPSRDPAQWVWVLPGAILACILWVVVSFGFTLYVSKFANYNESFGTLAGVIVLLMWLWISTIVIMVGAELNAEAERQTRKDSTTGPEMPAGQRGAEVADHLPDASDDDK